MARAGKPGYIILCKWHAINYGTQESGSIVYLLK